MQPEIELSIVLPAYREAENLRNLLPLIKQVAEAAATDHEILVVDTPEPTDDTWKICAEHGVRYIPRAPSDCYGDAVRCGIRQSRGRYVVFMDADGSHSPAFIPKLIEHAANRDVVIASRYMEGGSTANSFALTAMSRVLNVTFSLVLGLPCKDVSNSFRLYNGELLRQLNLTCSNFDIVEEILVRIRAARGTLNFHEVPFHFEARDQGETKRRLSAFIATYIATMARLWMVGRTATRPVIEEASVSKPEKKTTNSMEPADRKAA